MPLLSEVLGRRMRLPAPQTRDVRVQRDVAVPMDDGAVLRADRWWPGGDAPAPTVLVRSPYGRRGWVGLMFGRLLAERGLQVVVQSTRGTFGSGGEARFLDERDDGLATLRWLRAQPWHEGRVATTGPSYLGLVQWAIADEVDVMALSVTASSFRGMALGSGALSLDTALSWLAIMEVQERRAAPLHMGLALRRLKRTWDRLPLADLAEGPVWEEWVGSLAPDSPFWDTRDYTASIGRTRAATQLTAGTFDIFLPWQLEDFRALREAGREAQLVLAPGGHISSVVNAVALREAIAWLRAELLGDRRMVRDTPVRAYVSGGVGWRDLEDWPPPGAREHRVALGEGTARFTYDPRDPTPAVGGPTLFTGAPVVDNAPLEAREDVVVVTGEPLAADLDALGPVRAAIAFRSSSEHTDLFVRVCDVDRAGVSRNVCDGLVRLEPGRPEVVDLELWPAAHRFRAGHRIRVLVASGAHPRYARNPGTGEPPATATRLVAQHQEVDLARSSVSLTVL
jgi:uncharacterized protein